MPRESDGNWLLKACSAVIIFMDSQHLDDGEQGSKISTCIGYMQGIRDTTALYQGKNLSPLLVCFPEAGISNGQATRIVVKYLKNHPEKLHLPAISLAFSAFIEAFPCPKKEP